MDTKLKDKTPTGVLRKITPLIIKKAGRTMQAEARKLWARFYCPVCDSRVNSFEPLPDYFLKNQEQYGWPYELDDAETCNHTAYQCPHCQASDRDRLYAMYLKDYLAACPRDAGIVDFAPAAPLSDFIRRQIKNLGKNISYRTADAFAEGVDDQADITRLDIYRDGQFDFFICSHVLEHVPDDYQALRELHRILKPGGKGILMVPIILTIDEIDEDPSIVDEGERWRRFGQDDHIRLYSKRGFIERIRKSGFSVSELDQDFFGADSFKRNGISDKSVLYVVTK